MIEVKTSSNYKIAKTTINQRVGDDYEGSKPIVNFVHNDNPKGPIGAQEKGAEKSISAQAEENKQSSAPVKLSHDKKPKRNSQIGSNLRGGSQVASFLHTDQSSKPGEKPIVLDNYSVALQQNREMNTMGPGTNSKDKKKRGSNQRNQSQNPYPQPQFNSSIEISGTRQSTIQEQQAASDNKANPVSNNF